MSTGDLKNNIKKLQSQLKAVKYTGKLDLDGVRDGSPTAFLPLYHYVFTSYSNKLNKDISNSNNELYGKSDLRFIEAVYKILRDMFSYKPPVTRDQFFQSGFAERKVIMATEILAHVHSSYNSPSSGSSYKLASKLEKKQQQIHTKVQASLEADHRAASRTRKVAGKLGTADLTEAIVLPRYMTSSSSASSASRDWRDKRHSGPSTPTPTPIPTTIELSDTDLVLPDIQPKSPLRNGAGDSTNQATLQFTHHITSALTMLNTQVGNISAALEKVETQLASNDSPRNQQLSQPTPMANKLEMDTLASKVILLENRMTLLENKVEDIQACCTILLQNKNNSNDTNNKNKPNAHPHSTNDYSNTHSMTATVSDDGGGHGGVTKPADTERISQHTTMHPDYIKAFIPDTGNIRVRRAHEQISNNGSARERNIDILDFDDDGRRDADDEISTTNLVAEDNDFGTESLATRDMRFMKALMGQNESETSLLRDQDESTMSTLQQGLPSSIKNNEQNSSNKANNCAWGGHATVNSNTHRSQPETNNRFEHCFSPITAHADSSLIEFHDSSLIHIPCGQNKEEFESRRVSSTPNKADLDTSTLSRVNRIMQMMKETQQQFNQNS